MNTYWAEQHARQHIDQMAADASGGRQLAMATQEASHASGRPGPKPFRRARARIQAFAVRQLRFAARVR